MNNNDEQEWLEMCQTLVQYYDARSFDVCSKTVQIDMAIQVRGAGGGPAFWFENLRAEIWKIVHKINN